MRKIGGLVFKIKERSFKKKPNRFIFKKVKKGKAAKQSRFTLKNTLGKLAPFFVITIILLLAITFVYFLYRFVLDLRSDKGTTLNSENVYGFDIPAYPGSEFIFKDKLDDQTVKSFISLGNSVYRLSKNDDILKVFEYYSKELPLIGWQHVASVPISSEEKMYGEYWIKGEKGLRIYSRLNDVWYESITSSQANNGLEDIVKKDTARKLLLLTTEKTELLPDYPWRLSYPTEYTTKYYATSLSSIQGVRFQKIGSDNKVYLEPVGFFGAVSLDEYVDKFLQSYNKKNKSNWQVINSVISNFKGDDSVKASINNGKESASVYAIDNKNNNVVYILASFEDNDPFLNYIYQNLKPVLQTE